MNSITFKIINHDTPEYRAAVALREEILRKPLGLTFLAEELEAEKNHIHIVGFKGDEVIATAVLVPEGEECKMQRVVVRNDMQDSGIGSQMIAFCEEHAKARSFKSIYCHVRDSAVQFYLKNQYSAEGDYFDEDTIPHLKTRKYLLWEITESNTEEKSIILDKLVNFNRQVLGITADKPSSASLNYVIKLDDKIIGGINSCLYFLQSILHIDHLFVDEKHRDQQLGSALLKKVESEAKVMGASLVHLDTFDFQALDFYLKHGYEIFGVLEDCPKDHKRYFLKKSL